MSSRHKRAEKEKLKEVLVTAATIVLFALIVGGAIWFIQFRKTYTPQTDEVVFTRDIAIDQGERLDPMTVLSTGTSPIHLSDLCSKELQGRWGADGKVPGGVGLNATFVWKSGSRVISTNTVTIPSWQKLDDTPEPARRALVKNKCDTLIAYRDTFMAPVARTCNMLLVVDATSSIKPPLVTRASEVLAKANAMLNGPTCTNATGASYLYRLTANPSQSDRHEVDKGGGFEAGMKEATTWLFKPQGDQPQSSVLYGLGAALTEAARLPKSDLTRVNVFTDALENVGERSVYPKHHPELLNPENWAGLDVAWTPSELHLEGLDVHLYPLPGQSPNDAALSKKAFTYVKDRLEKAGATVTIEPL